VSDFVSQLPRYRAVKSKDFPNWLVVTCPRCDGVFLVESKSWMRPLRYTNRVKQETYVITGRSCPYCFKAGRLPMRREIG
jgi:uncharacterized C2H2 Zn-finger protein